MDECDRRVPFFPRNRPPVRDFFVTEKRLVHNFQGVQATCFTPEVRLGDLIAKYPSGNRGHSEVVAGPAQFSVALNAARHNVCSWEPHCAGSGIKIAEEAGIVNCGCYEPADMNLPT
jgi:hypothetical protein